MKKMSYRGVVSVLCGLILTSAAHAASINGMKVHNTDFTRVIFSADDQLQHKVMILDNPKRLVLDFKNANQNETIKMLSQHNWAKHRYITQTRVGATDNNTARVVFDLKPNVNVEYKVHNEHNDANAASGTSHQLVLDIFKLAL